MQLAGIPLRLLMGFAMLGCLLLNAQAANNAPELQIFQVPSPNFNDRPAGVFIDTVVIHATATQTWQEAVEQFMRSQAPVSAHYTITRRGRILMHVPEEKRAWHAGVSRMPDGRENVNDFSIGIELVNRNDGRDRYRREQMDSLEGLLLAIYRRHPIVYLVSHAQVAFPPGRSSDPQGLDLASLPQPVPRTPRWAGPVRAYQLLIVALAVGAGILFLIAVEEWRRVVPR